GVELNVNVALSLSTSPLGRPVIVVWGAVVSPGGVDAVSTVNARSSVAWFPAASVALTRNAYAPSESAEPGVWEPPVVHGPKLGVPASIEHSTELPASWSNVNVGWLALVVPAGPDVIETVGGWVSTTNVLATLRPALPAASV